jgi:hypothetical protein
LTHRELAKRDQRGFLEEVLERCPSPFRVIDDAAGEAIEQGLRRQVDHDDLVGLLHHPVGNRLPDTDAGALPDLIVQTLEVLHVHRREHVNAGIEQHMDVFPAFLARRAGNVGVRKLVHDGDARMPLQNRVRIHFLEGVAAIFDQPPWNDLQPVDERHRFFAPVWLEVADDHVKPAALQIMGLREHLKCLAHSRGVAEEDFQSTARGGIDHD